MRKIWTSRKDREKRKSLSSSAASLYSSFQYEANEGDANSLAEIEFNEDFSTLANSTVGSIAEEDSIATEKERGARKNGATTSNGKGTARTVASLVKHDWDSKVVKNGWLNVVVNSQSVHEISEQTLKLFRVELRGSHLYFYKPLANLNYRSFRISDSRDDMAPEQLNSMADMIRQAPPNISTSINADAATGGAISPTTAETTPVVETTFQVNDDSIKHPDIRSTHPELSYDFETRQFVSESTPEALIHFILFDVDPENINAINTAISVFPLFPNVGKCFKIMLAYIEIYRSTKDQDLQIDIHLISKRLSILLTNIEQNFAGFLLKSDIAPYILKLLESLADCIEKDSMEEKSIESFKVSMLSKQQLLVNLVSNENIGNNSNPFNSLNSTTFMKETNLIQLAATITSLDLMFFKSWNSDKDRSLILHSSLDGNSSADFFYKSNPLLFNNDTHIHYLSRLLINHIFVENTNSSSSTVLDKKARLLEKWIDLGCLLDKSGNMSSWLGIASIILSQPVLRLTKIWSLVSSDYIKLLKNDWSPVLFELDRRYIAHGVFAERSQVDTGSPDMSNNMDSADNARESYHIMAPRGLGKIYPKDNVIPYFGDLMITNFSTNVNELDSTWKRINHSFNRWNEYLSKITDYNSVIKYNSDVLRRYDSMGFIFSNESLNQVLYLGSNTEDNKPLAMPSSFDDQPDDTLNAANLVSRPDINDKLLRLIEANCESMNLEKIMALSLSLEPELPEAYLKQRPSSPLPPVSPLEASFKYSNFNSSSVSVQSGDSMNSLNTTNTFEANNISQTNDYSLTSRLPTLNNKYFKIDLAKYDELSSGSSNVGVAGDDAKAKLHHLDPYVDKHNYIVAHDLTFRVDDFITDMNNSVANISSMNAIDDVDNLDDDEDVPGLGIDIDDILNSEKFANISLNSDSKRDSEGNLDRKINNYSVISSDSTSGTRNPTYKYVPKVASVDKLIDLLLLDSRYFDQQISLDMSEYRLVFLSNYNSFMTTKELLEKLTHRFVNSGNAVISVMRKIYLADKNENDLSVTDFPNWNLDLEIDLNELGNVDYSLLLKIQINILKVLIVLLNSFYSNFSLDLENKKLLIKLLKLFSNEIWQWYNSNKLDSSLESPFESLVNYYKKLKKLFVKKTYRPIEISKFDEFLINEYRFSNTLHEVPMNRNLPGHKNVHKIEKFLHKFNKLLAVFYRGIKIDDWVKVFKLLEYQYENNFLLDFNLQKPSVSDESIIVSNIFNFFESLSDPYEKSLILKKFPLILRKIFKLYFKFRSYLLIQLTDLNITVEERLDRMKTMLIMVKISKLKMNDNQFVFEGTKETRENIPSCIETAIANVIYSPESRLFANLWIKASASLNENTEISYDSLDSLLPRKLTESDLQSTEPLLPCFGWIIENLMEINKTANFSKNNINFNKRYLMYKLIKELGIEDSELSENTEHSYHEIREFDFLLKLDESLINAQSLKDFTSLDKDRVKLFKGVLREQHKILNVDNKKKSIKNKKEALINANSITHTVTKKTSSSSLKRQSLSYKSSASSRFKISGFFPKSRPFSLGVAGLSTNPEKVIESKNLPAPEMHIDPKQKPYLVVSLKGKKIFPIYLSPLSFKIDTDVSNEDYLIQAPNERELNDWLMKINYANRHWFYSRSLSMKTNNPLITFGVPISTVCAREQTYCPRFLVNIFQEIENEGLKDVGIYRISSSVSELNHVKSIIDRTGTIEFVERSYDTHTLTSVVKSYFRELPDALLTDTVINTFVELKTRHMESEKENKQEDYVDNSQLFESYKENLKQLPLVNHHTLKKLIYHLSKIIQHSDANKMTSSNLATVIGPALTETSTLDSLIHNFGFMNSILETLIINYEYFFDDTSSKNIESL